MDPLYEACEILGRAIVEDGYRLTEAIDPAFNMLCVEGLAPLLIQLAEDVKRKKEG